MHAGNGLQIILMANLISCWEGCWLDHTSSGHGRLWVCLHSHFCSGMLPGTLLVFNCQNHLLFFFPPPKSIAGGSLLHRNQIILLNNFTCVFLNQIHHNEALWNLNIHCTAFQGNNSRNQLYLYSLSLHHILCSG